MAFGGEFFQQLRGGRPLAGLGLGAAGQPHLAEQDVAELFRRPDREALAGGLVDVLLQRRGALREFAGQPAKHLAVDRDAALFHARQHRHQRPLQPLVDGDQPVGGKPRLQHVPQAHGDVGALGGVGGGALDIDEVEGDEALAGADDILVRDHLVAEPALGERGDVVRAGAGAEHIGNQHRVVERADIDAGPVHGQPVVFEIVSDLQDRTVREQRLQRGKGLVDGDLVVGAAAAQQILRAGAMA